MSQDGDLQLLIEALSALNTIDSPKKSVRDNVRVAVDHLHQAVAELDGAA